MMAHSVLIVVAIKKLSLSPGSVVRAARPMRTCHVGTATFVGSSVLYVISLWVPLLSQTAVVGDGLVNVQNLLMQKTIRFPVMETQSNVMVMDTAKVVTKNNS
jgi:hypothetical protein